MFAMSIMSAIQDSLRTLMLDICSIIYRLIAFCFEVFYNLGTANLLNDDAVQKIISRFSLIIGIFMVFRVTFAFIQYIIDPDTMTDKNKGAGNIVKKIIIAIVLLGSTSFLFKFAFMAQEKILQSNVLEKIILSRDDVDSSNFGTNLSATLFTTFYRIKPNPSDSEDKNYRDCKDLVDNYLEEDIINNKGSLDLAYSCLLKRTDYPAENNLVDELSEEESEKSYIVDFDGGGLLAVIVGVIVLYVGFMFTLQVGVRLLQLVYLQIIAPIPIAMYITPKGDDNLKKWGQQCATTFLDFFLRVAILYFAIAIIEIIRDNNLIVRIYTEGTIYNLYVTCIMIIATLLFAKKIPALLKEIFPTLGGAAGFSYSLKMPDEAKKVGLFGAGTILGAAGAAASNLLYGAGTIRKNWKENTGSTGQKIWQATKGVFGTGASVIGGATSGFINGRRIKNLRGIRSTIQQTNENRDKRDLKQAAGYTVIDQMKDTVLGFAGLDTKAESMIKEAQWQQQAAEASRSAIWKKSEDAVKDGNLSYQYYAFARSLKQMKDVHGNVQWKGLDNTGKEIIIDDANLTTEMQRLAPSATDQSFASELAAAVKGNADVDKRIKEEGKKIKGLEAAKNDAKK